MRTLSKLWKGKNTDYSEIEAVGRDLLEKYTKPADQSESISVLHILMVKEDLRNLKKIIENGQRH